MIDIFVCKISEHISNSKFEELLSIISPEKQERIKRMRFKKDALCSLYGELIIRFDAAKICGICEKDIIIETGKCGKPYFKNLPLHFNISHSGVYVACAICDKNIGIDIEVNESVDYRAILKHLSKSEEEYIRNQNGDFGSMTFNKIWTLKEAYVKWLGTGLNRQLNSFSINILNGNIYVSDPFLKNTPIFKQMVMDDIILSFCVTKEAVEEESVLKKIYL